LEIITSHNSLDFDGLAGMVAAEKLYPNAIKVFSGTLSRNVKNFMALYKDHLAVRQPRDINAAEVSRMILIDTANANRLGYLKDLALRENMDFHIYDHHPQVAGDLQGSVMNIEQVGAATTILVEAINQQGIHINTFEATILALGIYEDTGSLLFSTTTARDAAAAAYLIGKGANLSVVANFMERPFSSEQRNLLQNLLNNTRYYKIENSSIVIAYTDSRDFVPGLDIVTHRLLEVEDCDAVFVVAAMQGKIHVIARSRIDNIRVNQVLKPLGGRGHEKAASALLKEIEYSDIEKIIIDELGKNAIPALLAGDIMSSPVKTIPKDISMEEAGRLMLRYGHTGMPVVEDDRMVGIISRRDVDKARTHELGHAPVKGFMTTDILSVEPDTTITEVQRIMVEKDIGRLPVIDKGKLTGIISRTDILRCLHGEDYPEDHELLYSTEDNREGDFADLIKQNLPAELEAILVTAGETAQELGMIVYCVGGFVRDLFLQVPNYDLDLVVEGEGKVLAEELAIRLNGRAKVHERFGTAMIILPDGYKIDVATARTEYYEFPAALPQVEKSSIREDLYRRDFTINTLALCLNPNRYGQLIDYFGGRQDIENGCIRILYNLSFVEDPTRILRAIRFEQRYQFKIEPDTLRFAHDAINRRLLGKLSYKRILQEMILILSERNPMPAIRRMKEIGVWQHIFPEVKLDNMNLSQLQRVPIVSGWFTENYSHQIIKSWIVYLLILLQDLSDEEVENVIERYKFERYAQKTIADSRTARIIARRIDSGEDILFSDLNNLAGNFGSETLIYFLLCLTTEKGWQYLNDYLETRQKVRVQIDGHDLRRMGIKQGPVYSSILNELYTKKINGFINTRDEEIDFVNQWLKEEKI
jgi:tRNA nucleotidyltransferase (CCA-adding enzyme)